MFVPLLLIPLALGPSDTIQYLPLLYILTFTFDSLLLINLSYPSPYNTRWEVFEQLRNNSYIKIWGADTNAVTIYNNGPYFDGTEPDSINRKIKLTVFNSICSAEKTKDITVYKDFSKNLIYNPP